MDKSFELELGTRAKLKIDQLKDCLVGAKVCC